MPTVRELVTVLKYRVDKSGLREYKNQAVAAARQIGGAVRTASAIGRGGFQGLALGIRDGIREQRVFIREQAMLLRQTRQTGHQFNALSGYIRTAFAGIGLAAFTGSVDKIIGSEAQIDLFAQNPANKKQIRDQIYSNAQAAGSDYLGGLNMFGSIARNRSTLGLTDEDAVRLADLTGKAVALTSQGAAQDSAAIMQFSQALGSGTLQGDELRSILENSGGLAIAISEAFGVSVDKLKEMGADGKLASDVMARGLLKQAEKIQAKFDQMPKGFGKGLTLIRNAWVKTARDINTATQASEGFFKISQLIAANLTGILSTFGLIGAAWGIHSAKNALRDMRTITQTINGETVKTVMNWRTFAMVTARSLLPLLRIAAILGSIYLIGEDISVWLKGGKSLIGTLIGPASEWKPQIDAVVNSLSSIKEWITGTSEGLGQWVTKWGTIATVVGGLYLLLAPFVAMVVNLATALIPLLWRVITMHPIGLLIAALITVIAKWDTIISKVKEAWGYISDVLGADGASFRNPDPNNPNENYGNASLRKQQNRAIRTMGQQAGVQDININQTNHITTNGSPGEVSSAVGRSTGRALEKGSRALGPVEATP
jgi:tape measure domain-containing protein